MKEIEKDFLLSNQQIGDLMDSMDTLLEKFHVQGQDLLRLKLSVEDVLLNFQDRFGSEQKAKMKISSRLGCASIVVFVHGEPFDPILAEQADGEEQTQGILFNLGLSTEYQYKKNSNVVVFPLPKKKVNGAWNLAVAIIAALLVGLIGNRLNLSTKESVDVVLKMVYDILFGLISMLAAPMVLFTMITGICEIGDVGKLKVFGKRVINAYLFPYLVGLLVCISLPFLFPLHFGTVSNAGSALESITGAIAGIFPSDIVSPFANGDFAQIVVVAILLGIGTLMISQEVPTVMKFVVQLNRIISIVLDRLCMLIPVIIFITIVQIIWSGEMKVIFSAWKPIVFTMIWALALLVWQILACARKIGEKASAVLKKNLQLLVLGLTTASSSACYSMMDHTANIDLRADRKLSGFALPIGLMLCAAMEFVEYLALAVYFGSVAKVEVTAAWLVLAVILSFVFSIATPPVTGGAVVVLSILLTILGVPTTYIGVAGAVTLLLDYPCTGIRVVIIALVSVRLSEKTEKL